MCRPASIICPPNALSHFLGGGLESFRTCRSAARPAESNPVSTFRVLACDRRRVAREHFVQHVLLVCQRVEIKFVGVCFAWPYIGIMRPLLLSFTRVMARPPFRRTPLPDGGAEVEVRSACGEELRRKGVLTCASKRKGVLSGDSLGQALYFW